MPLSKENSTNNLDLSYLSMFLEDSTNLYSETEKNLQELCNSCKVPCEDCQKDHVTNKMCLISFLFNRMENIFTRNNQCAKKRVLVNEIPFRDEKNYDIQKLINITSLILLNCKKCSDHDKRYYICPSNISLALIQIKLLGNKIKDAETFKSIFIENSVFVRIKRIFNYDQFLGKNLMDTYKRYGEQFNIEKY